MSQMAVRLSVYAPAGPPLLQGRFLELISVRGRVEPRATERLEGLGQLKKSIDLIGNRIRDLRLVGQCLNKLRYRVPFGPLVPNFIQIRQVTSHM
jgi:hypothetical protein